MNRIAAIALIVGATLMTTASAKAQGYSVEAKVPFSFTVNSNSLPAGNYTVSFDSMDPSVLIIRDRTMCVKARVRGMRGRIDGGKPGTLVFHQFGGKYFLSSVHFESTSNGFFFPATKLEEQARKAKRTEALNSMGAN